MQKRLSSSQRQSWAEGATSSGGHDGGGEHAQWRIYFWYCTPQGWDRKCPKGAGQLRKENGYDQKSSTESLPPTYSSSGVNSLLPSSGYTYLLSPGFKPHNILSFFFWRLIAVNLSNALTRYLTDVNLPSVPPPSGFILTSPWPDMSIQHYRSRGSSDTNYASGIALVLGNYALDGFIGSHSPLGYLYNSHMSPESLLLPKEVCPLDRRWPRTMIICGERR